MYFLVSLALEYNFLERIPSENRYYTGDDRQSIYQFKGCTDEYLIAMYYDNKYTKYFLTEEWIKYNQLLPNPVKRIYKTKGWLFVKMIVWNFLHPNHNKNKLTIEEVKNKLMKS